jgi:hypothetical protein
MEVIGFGRGEAMGFERRGDAVWERRRRSERGGAVYIYFYHVQMVSLEVDGVTSHL